MKIVWTRLAIEDLNNAYDYIASERPVAAAHIIGLVEKAVTFVAVHPDMGRPGRVEGTRELVVPGTPFIIPYRIKNKRVEVLAMIHGARRWPDSF